MLAVTGKSDLVTYDADHQLIAGIVNRAKPGWGKFVVLPNSDHLFHNFATEQDSLRNYQRGQLNIEFARLLRE